MPVPDSVITEPEGAVIVIDVVRARTDPAHAVVTRVPAGCSPVRMSMFPNRKRLFDSSRAGHIYVTARNSNAVLEFDAAKLISNSAHSMVGIAPTGDAPVPVMTVDKGRKIVVGNSNRFAGRGEPEKLVVLDASKIPQGLPAVTGVIPAGSFPREMSVSTDGRTLFLTNFGSDSLQVMNVRHLPIDPRLPPEIAKNADGIAHRHDYKPIVVDPKVLSRYVGVYAEAGGQPAVIDMDGDRLTAKLSSAPATEALPESDTKFFAMGMEIEFPMVPESGHAGEITLRQGQRERVLARLDNEAAKPILAAAAALAERMKNKTPLPGSEAAVRKLITDIQAGKPDESMFARGGQLFLRQLQPQVSQMGAVKSISFLTVGPAGPDIYTVETEKGFWLFRIWLSADGKVERAAAQLRPQ